MTDDRDPFEEGIKNLEELSQELKAPEIPADVDADFDRRMTDLEARASAARGVREAKQKQTERELKSDREATRGLGYGLSIAYTIIGLPLFGYGVGYLIDKSMGTEIWKGFAMLAGAVLGIGMAFWMMNKHESRK